MSGGGAERFSLIRPSVIVAVASISSSEDRVNGSFGDEVSARVESVSCSSRNSKAHALTPQEVKTRTVVVVTVIIYAYHLYPTIPNISMVYLLLILLLATTRGRYAAIVAAVVAFLAFDFFLVPPLFTFVISRWEEWIALFVFLV